MKRKELKRQEAEKRQTIRNNRTPAEQVNLARSRRGKSVKEIRRLMAP